MQYIDGNGQDWLVMNALYSLVELECFTIDVANLVSQNCSAGIGTEK